MDDVGALRDVPPDDSKVLDDLGDKIVEISAVALLKITNPTVGLRASFTSEHFGMVCNPLPS